jgi:hypothetical protein
LKPAQLTAYRDGQRLYRDAVAVLDADRSKRLAAEILNAIQAHVALLPPERRMLPARPPKAKAELKAILPPAANPPKPALPVKRLLTPAGRR